MSDQRYKTIRHIEVVRNYLNTCIKELLHRQEQHDQSKFDPEEALRFDAVKIELRDVTFGSDEYFTILNSIQPALDHHYKRNRHHPQHFENGINDMNLIDLLEMIVDWKSSSLRHDNGDIIQSIDINQKRFGYSDELKQILINTAVWLNASDTFHHAEES